MMIKQLTVFLQNEAGRLEELTKILGDAEVNISAMCIAENEEYGIMRMIVSDIGKAMDVLKENDFSVKVTDVIGLNTPDRPGELSKALKLLSATGINVSYMYGYSNEGTARLVLQVSDPQKANMLLQLYA